MAEGDGEKGRKMSYGHKDIGAAQHEGARETK